MWHLSLTNPQLFKPDKNDRKDLEYCYYLPHTQIFATKDKKLKRLMRALVRPDQSLVDGEELKEDLQKITEEWDRLNKEQRIALNAERGDAPPERRDSLVYKLWEKHDGTISPPRHKEIFEMEFVDLSLPEEQRVKFTFQEFALKKKNEIREGKALSDQELEYLSRLQKGKDPTTMRMFNSRVGKERLTKWYPELTEADVDALESEQKSLVWLDPYEYRNLLICNH